jgi:tRNA A-37 threonylcarbamoyl transferase component Bud32
MPFHERRTALAAAGKAIRALHDAGCVHGDLHLGNILWDGSTAKLLDLGGSVLQGRIDEDDRWKDLLRLLRSALKWRERLNCVSGDALRLLEGYAGGESRWRGEIRRRVRKLSWRLPLHRLAWRRRNP